MIISSFGRRLLAAANGTIAGTIMGLGTAAFKNTGTSGNTVPLLDGVNTWSGIQTFSANPSVTGGGISFPATQVASGGANVLDDYEEGTWSGTVTADTGTFTTVALDEAIYTKIGNVVTVWGRVNITTAGTAAGDIILSGAAPFSSAATIVGAGREFNINGFVCWAFITGTTIRIRKYDNTTIIGNGVAVRFTITYRV